MSNLLFLDTETTGFRRSGSLTQHGQARVCQVGMILTNNRGRILTEFQTLVKPQGWVISEGAQRTHGVSQKDCEDYGISQQAMMGVFLSLSSLASIKVAHNAKFDKAIMEIENAYLMEGSVDYNPPTEPPWYCTQENTKDICRIPPTPKMVAAGRTHFKTPSLAEAYMHFTGKKLEGAHDAMVDTRACLEIYFNVKGIQV